MYKKNAGIRNVAVLCAILLIFGIALFGCFGQIRNSLQQQLMSSIEGMAEQNEILIEKEVSKYTFSSAFKSCQRVFRWGREHFC